jgi:hypothetical protein
MEYAEPQTVGQLIDMLKEYPPSNLICMLQDTPDGRQSGHLICVERANPFWVSIWAGGPVYE